MNNRNRFRRPRLWALVLGALILSVAAIYGDSGNSSAARQSGRRAPDQPQPNVPISAPGENPPPPVRLSVTPSPREMTALPEEIMSAELQSLDGAPFRLTDFRGRVVILNLWATWCGPCRQEIPHFNELRRRYPDSRLQIVGLTTENPETHSGAVRQFARQMDIKYRLGWAERPFAEALMSGRRVIPQTYVIGADGQVVERLVGFSSNRTPAALRAAVERALREAE